MVNYANGIAKVWQCYAFFVLCLLRVGLQTEIFLSIFRVKKVFV